MHWLRWGGCDFGWTHYAAFCELAWDRDLDIIYLVRTLRLKEQEHAQAIRHWRLMWAWSCDGKRTTLEGAGVPLMQQYADAGLGMMHQFAQFDDGSVSVEAGLMEMAQTAWAVDAGRCSKGRKMHGSKNIGSVMRRH